MLELIFYLKHLSPYMAIVAFTYVALLISPALLLLAADALYRKVSDV